MAGRVAGDLAPTVVAVGVDGCPAGWLAVGVDADGEWSYGVFGSFASLWEHLDVAEVEQVLVDVPIGLRDDRVRACDEAARELLGCRWNSVFRAPVRAAVDVKREEDPEEDRRPAASSVNETRTGYGLSAQVWNIADAIAELDDFVRAHDLALDGVVREAHPELAFMAFNGQPVAYGKQRPRGADLRRSLLAAESSAAADAVDETRATLESADVGDDDVLDATALALAARTPLTTVPADVDEDQPRIYYPDREPAWDAQSYRSG